MTSSSIDYEYLRTVVMRNSGNQVDPSRDYLFESRLQRLLRDRGLQSLSQLVSALRAEAGAHSGVSRCCTGQTADRRGSARRFANRLDVAGLVALAFDLAFRLVQRLRRPPVQAGHAGTKIARHSVGQRQRIEPDIQLTAALHAARPLHFGHGSGNIAARRNHDMRVHQDGKHRL